MTQNISINNHVVGYLTFFPSGDISAYAYGHGEVGLFNSSVQTTRDYITGEIYQGDMTGHLVAKYGR